MCVKLLLILSLLISTNARKIIYFFENGGYKMSVCLPCNDAVVSAVGQNGQKFQCQSSNTSCGHRSAYECDLPCGLKNDDYSYNYYFSICGNKFLFLQKELNLQLIKPDDQYFTNKLSISSLFRENLETIKVTEIQIHFTETSINCFNISAHGSFINCSLQYPCAKQNRLIKTNVSVSVGNLGCSYSANFGSIVIKPPICHRINIAAATVSFSILVVIIIICSSIIIISVFLFKRKYKKSLLKAIKSHTTELTEQQTQQNEVHNKKAFLDDQTAANSSSNLGTSTPYQLLPSDDDLSKTLNLELITAQQKDEFQIFHLPTFSVVIRKHKIYNLADVVDKIKTEIPCINRPIVVCHWTDPLRRLAPSQKAFRMEGDGLQYVEYFIEDTCGSKDWQSQMAELRDWDVLVSVNASTSEINLQINRPADPMKWRQYATVSLDVRDKQQQLAIDIVHMLVTKNVTGDEVKAAFIDFQRFACYGELFKTLDESPAECRDGIRWLYKWTTTRVELLTFYLSNQEKLSNIGPVIATIDKEEVCRISVVQKVLKQLKFIPMPSESPWTKESVAKLLSQDYILILCVTDDELAWAVPNTHCRTVTDVEKILRPSALGSSMEGRLQLIGTKGQLQNDATIDEIGTVIHYAVVLPYENVKKIANISSGSYGSVSKCKIGNESATYAIKEILICEKESEDHRKSRINEVMVTARVGSHPNVVKYHRFLETDLAFYIVMDYMEESLDCHVIRKFPLDETEIISFAKQILEGLKHLHDQKVIHRDIKSKNVLIDENGCAKLCDFGISKCQTVDTDKAARKGGNTQIGTHRYMAPELLGPDRPHGYGQKTDVWAFGVLMVEMITGKGFYPGLSDIQVERRIRNDRKVEYEFPSSRYGGELKEFVDSCLVCDLDGRPTCAKLLENIIFA